MTKYIIVFMFFLLNKEIYGQKQYITINDLNGVWKSSKGTINWDSSSYYIFKKDQVISIYFSFDGKNYLDINKYGFCSEAYKDSIDVSSDESIFFIDTYKFKKIKNQKYKYLTIGYSVYDIDLDVSQMTLSSQKIFTYSKIKRLPKNLEKRLRQEAKKTNIDINYFLQDEPKTLPKYFRDFFMSKNIPLIDTNVFNEEQKKQFAEVLKTQKENRKKYMLNKREAEVFELDSFIFEVDKYEKVNGYAYTIPKTDSTKTFYFFVNPYKDTLIKTIIPNNKYLLTQEYSDDDSFYAAKQYLLNNTRWLQGKVHHIKYGGLNLLFQNKMTDAEKNILGATFLSLDTQYKRENYIRQLKEIHHLQAFADTLENVPQHIETQIINLEKELSEYEMIKQLIQSYQQDTLFYGTSFAYSIGTKKELLINKIKDMLKQNINESEAIKEIVEFIQIFVRFYL